MTIVQMQYFRAACQYQSLAEASEALHISQPSISVAIRDIEREFNTALFYRINKRLTLTHEGLYFLEKIDGILNEIDALEKQMNSMGNSKKLLRIATSPIAGSSMLPGIIAGFKETHPEIGMELKECNYAAALKTLENNDCDVALIVNDGTLPKNCHGIIVNRTDLALCVRKDHPLAERECIEVSDIVDTRLILPRQESFITSEIKSLFYKNGFVPDVLMYATESSLVSSVLRSSSAAAIISMERGEKLEGCVAIPFKESVTMCYMVVWLKGRYLPGNGSKFLDYLREAYPESEKIE